MAGGKASGEARRHKADFRRTQNLFLTTWVVSKEWTPLLEAMGLKSTLGSSVNRAMIKEALSGNVKVYEAVARYAGQTDRTEVDEAEQKVRTEAVRVRYGQEDEEERTDDGFLEAL